MERILDRPVAAHGTLEGLCLGWDAGDVAAALGGDLAFDLPSGFDHSHAAQSFPGTGVGEPADLLGHPVSPPLDAPMRALAGFQKVAMDTLKVPGLHTLKKDFHLLMEGALIAFERLHPSASLRAGSIGPGAACLAGDLCLATHRVNGHDAARQLQGPQQLGNGRDLPAPSGAALRAKAPPFGCLAPLGSLLLSSTLSWPSTSPFSRAHALTI